MRTRCYGVLLGAAMLAGITACASSSSPPGSFQPAGGGASSAAAPPPVAVTSKIAHFPFPADIHVRFSTPLPADPQQAAAVIADDDYQLGYLYAIYSGGRNMSVLNYVAVRALPVRTATISAVSQSRSETFTGSMRYYDTTVQPAAGASSLTVTSCVNDAQMLTRYRGTGAIVPGQSTAPRRSVYLETDTLAQAGGSWKVIAVGHVYYPNGAAKECYP